MNHILLALKRPFVWLLRFRHRCGYGVHSPFAFDLITQVIYEKTPYYKYRDLTEEEDRLAYGKDKDWKMEPKKVKQLLLRLVNYVRPTMIVDVGTLSASALYLKAGREQADYTFASELSGLFLEADVPVDFVYIHDYRHPQFVEDAFRICVARTTPKSVFVIEGIRYSSKMRTVWRRIQHHPQASITFDLYDIGLIFFDNTKIKQDYIVNF